MAIVYGTVGQKSSKYTYYLDYSVTLDPETLEWVVTAIVKLVVKAWKYSGKTTYALSIGDVKVDSLASTTLTRGDNKTDVTYNMGTGSQRYAASTSKRTITISATLNAPSGGYGPGSCSVSTTIELNPVLSSSGKIVATDITPTGCTLNVSELGKNLGYAKECYFYYRVKGTEKWTRFSHVTVPDAETTCTTTVTGLTPGETYELDCDVYTPNPPDKKMAYFATTVTFPAGGFTLSLQDISYDEISVEVSGMDQIVSTYRELRFYKKKSIDTSWGDAGEVNIEANVAAGIIGKPVYGLDPNTAYDIKVEMYYDGVLTDSAVVSATTLFLEDYEIMEPWVSDGEILIRFTDNAGKGFRGDASLFIRGYQMPYEYAGSVAVDFTADPSCTMHFPTDNITVINGAGDYPAKLIFSEGNPGSVKDIFQMTLTHE